MNKDHIIVKPIEDVMGDRFGRYSKYIIQERALPDVRDGLKPVQRRILYAMYKEGNFFNKPYRKSAKTVGIVIGNYHPHGDSSVYDAMVRLSQSWKVNMPLIDMQGNNGSIDDDPAAAMRYTEARLAKIADYLLANIDEEVVPFVLNFDDMTTEPSVLPASYPNLLVNGSTGIAAGYATNIPPFNLGEIVDATIYRLKHPECSVEDIMGLVQGPDFPTGAIIQGKEGILNILKTGRGRVVVRAKAEIVDEKKSKSIVITELPYEVIKSNLVRKIDELRYAKANEGLGGVIDVRDESDRNGLRIVIECDKKSDVESILNMFYKFTDLQVYYNANMVSIVNQTPVLCGVDKILDSYIEFRKEVVINRSQYRFNQKNKRLHIIDGLIKAMSILDEIIYVIRSSANRSDSRDNLMEQFGFTHEQASAIVDLQLYRLSSTDVVALQQEHHKLSQEIKELQHILESQDALINLIVEELYDVKETLFVPRRSIIESEISELEVDHMRLIPDETVMLTLSNKGYVKKVSLRSYGSSNQEEVALMDEDYPIIVGEVKTKDTLLFITSKGRYGTLLIHDIEEAKWKDVGSHLNQYITLDNGESIVNAFTLRDFNKDKYVITVTKQGMIKKTSLEGLDEKRVGRLYEIMNVGKDDIVVSALIGYTGDDAFIFTKDAKCLRFNLIDVKPTGLKGKGVIGIRLTKGDFVAGAILNTSDTDIIVSTNRNAMKRIKMDYIDKMDRARRGVRIAKPVKTKPHDVMQVISVSPYETISLYTNGIKILDVSQIPLMNLDATYSQVLDEPYTFMNHKYASNEMKVNNNVKIEEEKPIEENFKFDI